MLEFVLQTQHVANPWPGYGLYAATVHTILCLTSYDGLLEFIQLYSLLLWTLKNKDTSIIRTVVFGPKAVRKTGSTVV